jgi:hypothetical protein
VAAVGGGNNCAVPQRVMRWNQLAALLVASSVIPVACGNESEVAVLGATATRPEIAQFAPTEEPLNAPATTTTATVETTVASGSNAAIPSSSTDVEQAATTTSSNTAPAVAQTSAADEAAQLGAAAETLIEYPFRAALGEWTIRFAPDRGSVRGLTFPRSFEIEIYLREGDTAATVARVLAHEVGHALDVTYNDDGDRARWRDARGIDQSVPWWPDGTTFDFDTGSGDWAESFAVMQTGATNQSSVAGGLTTAQVEVLVSLLP